MYYLRNYQIRSIYKIGTIVSTKLDNKWPVIYIKIKKMHSICL